MCVYMSLQKTLLESPREKGGSRASNRLDYQKNWALCKLLELHSEKEDYLLILDLHDDILVLNSSEKPNLASFYQVKTNNKGFWGLSDLIKKEKKQSNGNPCSKLGKLYFNKIKFKENVKELSFVSNAYYRVKLNDKTKKSIDQRYICIAEIQSEERDKILQSISTELSLTKENLNDSLIFLRVCDLNLSSHTETTKGKLSDFLDEQMPKSNFKIGIIYRTLFDEIKRRTNEELDCNSFQELLKYKAISREGFEGILKNISESFSQDNWADILSLLNSEGFSLSEKMILKNHWERYKIEKMDPSNQVILSLKSKILKIKRQISNQEILTCRDLFNKFLAKFEEVKTEEENNLFNLDYLKAIILAEYYNNE